MQLSFSIGAAPEQLPYPQAIIKVQKIADAGRAIEAESLFLQIIEQAPELPTAAIHLLSSYQGRRAIAEGDLLAARMLALYSEDPDAVVAVARFHMQLGKMDHVISLLEPKIEGFNKHSNLFRTLAYAYISTGDKDKARSYFEQAISLDPKNIGAYWGLVRLLKGNMPSGYIKKLIKFSQQNKFQSMNRALLFFSLAWFFEQQDTDKYFHYLHLANAALGADHKSKLDSMAGSYEELKNLFSDVFIAKYSAAVKSADSPVFIAAMPRSGTTLVEQILGSHSETFAVGESSAIQVAAAEVASQYRLPAETFRWDVENYGEYLSSVGDKFYQNSLIKEAGAARVIDKSLELENYVGLILLAWPNAKLIRLKREPMDLILSCYHQLFDSGLDYLFNLEGLAKYYLAFQKQMDLWDRLFPGRILTLHYEDLVRDQQAVTESLLDYCGLEWEDSCLHFYRQTSSVVTNSVLQVQQPIYDKSIGRWLEFKDQLKPAIEVLEKAGMVLDKS